MNFNLKYLIIGLVIVVLGGIMLLATHTWNPSWNPFKEKEEKRVIEKVLENTFQTKTYRFEEKIELKTEEGEGVSLDITGVVDQSDLEDIKSDSSLKVEISAKGVNLEGAGRLITSRDIFYLKIDSLPPLPFLSKEILEGIKDQWVMIDIKELKEKEWIELEFSETKEEALIEEIKQLIKNKEFFEIKKRASEKINGVKTTYYSTLLKKETIKETIPQLLLLTEKYTPEAEKETTKKEIEMAIKDFEEKFDPFWEIISPLEFDFWIEKNLWLRKIKFEKELDLAKLGLVDPTREKKIEGKANIFFEIKFFDFDKEIKVEMPENYKTLEEIFSSLIPFFSPEVFSLPKTEGEIEGEIPDFSVPDFSLPDFSP